MAHLCVCCADTARSPRGRRPRRRRPPVGAGRTGPGKGVPPLPDPPRTSVPLDRSSVAATPSRGARHGPGHPPGLGPALP